MIGMTKSPKLESTTCRIISTTNKTNEIMKQLLHLVFLIKRKWDKIQILEENFKVIIWDRMKEFGHECLTNRLWLK